MVIIDNSKSAKWCGIDRRRRLKQTEPKQYRSVVMKGTGLFMIWCLDLILYLLEIGGIPIQNPRHSRGKSIARPAPNVYEILEHKNFQKNDVNFIISLNIFSTHILCTVDWRESAHPPNSSVHGRRAQDEGALKQQSPSSDQSLKLSTPINSTRLVSNSTVLES